MNLSSGRSRWRTDKAVYAAYALRAHALRAGLHEGGGAADLAQVEGLVVVEADEQLEPRALPATLNVDPVNAGRFPLPSGMSAVAAGVDKFV
ncbi:MAG TPA: hypothetical protein VMM77_00170 [Gemmatimonadaceae bacterium]|nr:hypothetical protein [Gemmatimonadaceae bacterium]